MSTPSRDGEFDSWEGLAEELGTTTKTLRAWREKFPSEWPRPRDGWHNAEQWRAFALERGLRPAREYETSVPPPKADAESTAWNRMESLFPVMQVMQTAYEAGKIGPRNYLHLGAATLPHVKAISEIWGTDMAPDGWDVIWDHIAREVEKRISPR